MGLFDNAKSVVINGKEVKSIKTSNGGVLYEKESDFIYEDTTEHTLISGWETLTNTIPYLPNKFELTVDLFTSGVVRDAEQRLYLCPSSAFNGSSQPAEAVFVGFNRPFSSEYGYRKNNSTTFYLFNVYYPNQWINFKIVFDGSYYNYYINNVLCSATHISYQLPSDEKYVLCIVNWNTGSTFKCRNLRIKELE